MLRGNRLLQRMARRLRTAVVKDAKLYIQAGGGVVYDSDPEAEYMETVFSPISTEYP